VSETPRGGTTMDAVMRPEVVRQLRELHEHYIYLVNEAVAEGRESEVEELAARYPDEAARLILAHAA
jgi:hypothetical protein